MDGCFKKRVGCGSDVPAGIAQPARSASVELPCEWTNQQGNCPRIRSEPANGRDLPRQADDENARLQYFRVGPAGNQGWGVSELKPRHLRRGGAPMEPPHS